jgi:hypothetical protein
MQLYTGEGMGVIMYKLMKIKPFAPLYFITFQVILIWLISNLFVGVVIELLDFIEDLEDAAKAEEEEEEEAEEEQDAEQEEDGEADGDDGDNFDDQQRFPSFASNVQEETEAEAEPRGAGARCCAVVHRCWPQQAGRTGLRANASRSSDDGQTGDLELAIRVRDDSEVQQSQPANQRLRAAGKMIKVVNRMNSMNPKSSLNRMGEKRTSAKSASSKNTASKKGRSHGHHQARALNKQIWGAGTEHAITDGVEDNDTMADILRKQQAATKVALRIKRGLSDRNFSNLVNAAKPKKADSAPPGGSSSSGTNPLTSFSPSSQRSLI